MNSLRREFVIKELIELIQAKQLEIEQARKDDLVFAEIKKLYLDLKDLNSRLAEVLKDL